MKMMKQMNGRKSAAVLGGLFSLLLIDSALAAQQYSIVAIDPLGTDTTGLGQGISTTGNFAAGVTESTAGYNAVLFNVSSGVSTKQTQTGVTNAAGTIQKYGQAYSVNNNGVIFGSSGSTTFGTGSTPTVWQNGAGITLQLPLTYTGGQVFGSNDNNQAAGVVGQASLNQAAIFNVGGPAFVLSQLTTDGYSLNTAYAINNAGQIVGQANQLNSGAGYVPFFLDANATTATVIPSGTPYAGSTFSAYNGGEAFDISSNGLVCGTQTFNQSNSALFLYNSSSGVTTTIPLPAGASTAGNGARGVNSSGEVVGTASGATALPFLFDGSNTYQLSTLIANDPTGAWHLSDNTSSGAFGIADNGDIVGRANHNGVLTGFVMIPLSASGVAATPTGAQTLTFNNTGGTGDGTTWDTTQGNFNNGIGATAFTTASVVTFNDVNNGNYTVTIPATVTPGLVTVNNSAGNYVFSGAGGIFGSTPLTKLGTGTLTLSTTNTYTGPTTASGGTLVFGTLAALPNNNTLIINGGAKVVLPGHTAGPDVAATLASLAFGGTTNAWTGTLDLSNDDLIVHGGSLTNTVLPTLTNEIKQGLNLTGTGGLWNGSGGILSSVAAANTTGLTALGILLNNDGTGVKLFSTFDSTTVVVTDVLIKYTYFGDANLDGHVDGSDYTRIDNGYNRGLTGWGNGDFNYDGVVNGSDYTLIDNSFNTQGGSLEASATDQVSGSSVPEPASLGLLGIGAIGLMSRRRRQV